MRTLGLSEHLPLSEPEQRDLRLCIGMYFS
jgi:hypothetical protein